MQNNNFLSLQWNSSINDKICSNNANIWNCIIITIASTIWFIVQYCFIFTILSPVNFYGWYAKTIFIEVNIFNLLGTASTPPINQFPSPPYERNYSSNKHTK